MRQTIGMSVIALCLLIGHVPAQADGLGMTGDGLQLLGYGRAGHLSIVAYSQIDAFGFMTVLLRNNTGKTVDWADGGIVIYDKDGNMAAVSDKFYPKFAPLAPNAVGVADAQFSGEVPSQVARVEAKLTVRQDDGAHRVPLALRNTTVNSRGVMGLVVNEAAPQATYPITVVGGCVDDAGHLLATADNTLTDASAVLKRGDSLPFSLALTGNCPHVVLFATGGI